jgi:hypothetical protein
VKTFEHSLVPARKLGRSRTSTANCRTVQSSKLLTKCFLLSRVSLFQSLLTVAYTYFERAMISGMSTKITIALAVASGFIGGMVSQHIMGTAVLAREQASTVQEVRAHKFVLVDDAGIARGIFGFEGKKTRNAIAAGSPNVEMMDATGHRYGFATNQWNTGDLLPEATSH